MATIIIYGRGKGIGYKPDEMGEGSIGNWIVGEGKGIEDTSKLGKGVISRVGTTDTRAQAAFAGGASATQATTPTSVGGN